jgi:hypothetical protein
MDQSRVLRASLRPSLGTAGCTAHRGPQDCQAALGSKALSARLPQDLFPGCLWLLPGGYSSFWSLLLACPYSMVSEVGAHQHLHFVCIRIQTDRLLSRLV